MVLLVGLDSDAINDPSNRAAPKGPANADSLMLIRVEAGEALQVLQVPTELAVQLPGREEVQPLARAYREGGVDHALPPMADVLAGAAAEVLAAGVAPRVGEPIVWVEPAKPTRLPVADGAEAGVGLAHGSNL